MAPKRRRKSVAAKKASWQKAGSRIKVTRGLQSKMKVPVPPEKRGELERIIADVCRRFRCNADEASSWLLMNGVVVQPLLARVRGITEQRRQGAAHDIQIDHRNQDLETLEASLRIAESEQEQLGIELQILELAGKFYEGDMTVVEKLQELEKQIHSGI